jgi:hypothetical protein
MKSLQVYIAQKQAEFARHTFFQQLQAPLPFAHALGFAPHLTFWVMAFQDVLRLNEKLTTDPELRRIAKHHRAEDSGHDRWFLDDLNVLGQPPTDVRWLFSKSHAPTRDAAHALMAEVFRAQDDRLRLVLLMTLESAGHIFFERIAQVVHRAGKTDELKYFSFSHLEVEKSHEVFESEMARKIDAIVLSPELRSEADAVVDRCYAAFASMFEAVRASLPLDAGVLEAVEQQAPLAAVGN